MKIFISHSSKDLAVCKKLADVLMKRGYEVFACSNSTNKTVQKHLYFNYNFFYEFEASNPNLETTDESNS